MLLAGKAQLRMLECQFLSFALGERRLNPKHNIRVPGRYNVAEILKSCEASAEVLIHFHWKSEMT
ncbi:hypothetical protein M513_02095 [Trichuris suis]|nr:hypothetical protein M513_02095 [Trichuris suis]